MKNKATISILLLVLVAIVIGLFSYFNIWLGDDVSYAYFCGDKDRHLKSILELIPSQNIHYMQTNGRYVAHVLVQGFCGLWGIGAFSIANGLMYILFFLAIFRLCGIGLDNVKGVASIIILSLLSFQTKMQPSCQIGFVWMFTLTLWTLILFFHSKDRKPAWLCILSGLGAIIAGNGQEVLNLGVCAAFFFYWLINMKKMSAMQYCIMIGFWIGALTNFLSPGTINRGSGMMGTTINRYIFSFISYMLSLRIIWVLCFVALYQKIKHKISFREMYKSDMFYWNALFALMLFSLICHFQSNRVGFGVELMSLIIVIRILPNKSMNYFWLAVASVLLLIDYVMQTDATVKSREIMKSLQKEYDESTDGKVYADISFDSHLGDGRNFSRPLVPYGVTNGGDHTYYEYNCLAKKLSETSPGRPKVKIIPTILRGKEHEDLGNQLIYTGNDIWLVIQSKSAPAEFIVYRETPLIPSIKHYDPVIVEIDKESIVAEGDNWRARFIAEIDHAIHNMNFTSSVEMIEPQKTVE